MNAARKILRCGVMIEGMAGVVHISEEEAAKDFAGLFERVRAGERVIVEAPGRSGVMMMVPDEPVRARSITAILEGLRLREASAGLVLPDDDFAADVAEAHKRLNQPLDSSKWD